MNGTEIVLNAEIISLALGTVIPLLVGLLTKLNASSGVKAVTNAFLSAVAGVLTSIQDAGGEFVLEAAVTTTVLTWAISVATHYGLWRPTHAAQAVQSKTARFGLGGDRRGPGHPSTRKRHPRI